MHDEKNDNGEMNLQQKQMKERKVCGFCKYRFPNHHPFMLMIPEQQKIRMPGKQPPKVCPTVICDNLNSPKCQMMLGINGTCEHWDGVVPEQAVAPKKIADRLKFPDKGKD